MCSAHQPDPALQFVVEDETKRVKWYKNHRFWTVVASILVTELLLIAGLIMVIRFKHYKVIWFEWWRWLFFFSGQNALLTSQSVGFTSYGRLHLLCCAAHNSPHDAAQ